MNQVSRYILRQLAIVTVFVAVTLTCAVWLAQSLRFIGLIVSRGLTIGAYFNLTGLLLPSFLSMMLPIALFTAVTFTYNRLTTDSELIVMRAMGISPGQISRPALTLAVIVVAINYLLALYVLPWSYQSFKDLESDFRNDYSGLLLTEGAFNVVSDGITVYIRSRETDGELQGILMHDTRVADRPVTVMAERGMLVQGEDGPRVVMENGNRQAVDKRDGKLQILYFDRYSVDLGKISQSQQDRIREPRERYISELLFPGDTPYERANIGRLRAELHNRIATPLLGLAFTMIGLAALISGEFNRRGQTRRLVAAVGLVSVLQVIALALYNAQAKVPMLAALPYLAIAVAIVGGWWWLNRPVRRRRAPANWIPAGA